MKYCNKIWIFIEIKDKNCYIIYYNILSIFKSFINLTNFQNKTNTGD